MRTTEPQPNAATEFDEDSMDIGAESPSRVL